MQREGRSRQVAGEVRAVLARRQISGKQLASQLGMSQFAISRRLRGETPFSIDELAASAEFLGVPLTELLPSSEELTAADTA
jgi:transcriptional regulator with XRE-family HTH domain